MRGLDALTHQAPFPAKNAANPAFDVKASIEHYLSPAKITPPPLKSSRRGFPLWEMGNDLNLLTLLPPVKVGPI
jgi:hypothetical protein